MSRHRAVRNLDLDDVLDEDQLDTEYDENQLDESQLSNEDLDALEEGLDYVYGVIGQDVPLTDVEIKEALWYYYFDKDETVNWALEKVASIKVEQDKQKAKEAKKTKVTRKPHYRRPPSKMYMDESTTLVTCTTTPLSQLAGKSSLSSLASLRSSTGPKSSLSSLVSVSKSSSTNTDSTPSKTSGGGSLLSLAQKSAGQRNMSALQNLANRQKSTATSLSKPPGQQSTSLAHLASRAKANNQSNLLGSLASSAKTKGTSNLLGLGTRNNTPTLDGATIQAITTNTKEIERKEATGITIASNNHFSDITKQPNKKMNPLIAPPSPAAVFLFQPREQSRSSLSVDITMALPNSLAQAFYEAMPPSSKLFKFDAPSPDDIVFKAQNQRINKAK
ncbi:hypothetical protein BC941DRAFT_472662 [Chlamydoabsidia padenii]|nr:hypothetical protein BC941DRAFT_472662 [Chlamydoabsidia padenii]